MTPVVFATVSDELHTDENDILKVYDDATGQPITAGTKVFGNPSIGTGRNLAAKGITRAESDFLLINDCTEAETELVPLLPWLPTITPNRQAAVYSLYFNVGLGNPQHFVGPHGWPNFLAQMAAGEYEAAATNLETSQPWAGQVGTRAARLANLVRNG